MKDLTSQQLEKDVKRINERINEIVKLLGSDSEAYQKYVSRLKALLPSRYVRIDKYGLVKIARTKNLYNQASDEKIQRAFEQILKTPTAGQLKKKAKEVIIKERRKQAEEDQITTEVDFDTSNAGNYLILKPEKPTNAEIIDKAKQIDRVEKFVSDNQEMFYVAYKDSNINDLIHISGRKKTYTELNKIVKEYENKKYEEITTIFDDLE